MTKLTLSLLATTLLAPISALNYLEQLQNVLQTPGPAYDHCPIDIPISCTNKTEVKDSCCFEYPGGVVLQTQFWDYYPPVGPSDLFTLHGLWPDNCDGSYQQFCDSSLNIAPGVSQLLREANETQLLDKMSKYWKNFNGKDEELWQHEFNKHGTCMTTIKPQCYGSEFDTNRNVVDYYRTSVELFEQLPTYEWLLLNGIVPSESQTYSKQQIEDTLRSHFGQPVYISCNRYHALQEIWYFYHVKGSVLTGDFVPIPSLMSSNKCPDTGIKFLPKGFTPPLPTHTNPSAPPTPTGNVRRGFLKLSDQPGCLIGNGRWYTSGTCATFSLTKAQFGGYNLKSSKGWCEVDELNQLNCNQKLTPLQFQFDKDKSLVSYGGKLSWSLDEVASRFKQVPISPGYDGEVKFKLRLEARG